MNILEYFGFRVTTKVNRVIVLKMYICKIMFVKEKKIVKEKLGCSFKLSKVPGAGIEPARPQWSQDFKSCVSTSFTTRALT
jgi:hypothetical protein